MDIRKTLIPADFQPFTLTITVQSEAERVAIIAAGLYANELAEELQLRNSCSDQQRAYVAHMLEQLYLVI